MAGKSVDTMFILEELKQILNDHLKGFDWRISKIEKEIRQLKRDLKNNKIKITDFR